MLHDPQVRGAEVGLRLLIALPTLVLGAVLMLVLHADMSRDGKAVTTVVATIVCIAASAAAAVAASRSERRRRQSPSGQAPRR